MNPIRPGIPFVFTGRRGNLLGVLVLLMSIAGVPYLNPQLRAAPGSFRVEPEAVGLRGRRDTFQILVEEGSGERMIDRTSEALYTTSAPEVVGVSPRGLLEARSDGRATSQVRLGASQRVVDVTVTETGRPGARHFERDVVPVLTRYGCSSSTCHGKAEGQNGFKLSIFSFDPAADYEALIRDSRGRRVNTGAPDLSLLLRKASGDLPHGGGRRFEPDSRPYRALREWIESGAPEGDSTVGVVTGLRIEPAERRFDFGSKQQLRVTAIYEDGRQVDVTAMAKYQSNNEGIATVDEEGLMSVGHHPGQVAIMANYRENFAVCVGIVTGTPTGLAWQAPATRNFVDELVWRKLQKLHVLPSEPASDADFLRRIYIDLVGTLPTSAEARAFLSDEHPQHRERLVDALLKRPEYATYWALRWADLLRVDRGALGSKEAYAYYRWIRSSVAMNKPVDQFARELLTAEGPVAEAPQASLFKAIQDPGKQASAISQVFLGIRIECAECHHHPFDRWSQADYHSMTAFFKQLKWIGAAESQALIAEGPAETTHPRTGEVLAARPLGSTATAAPNTDSRQLLAHWMTAPDNPWFARNVVNRIWAHFLGRGIVEPVDDVRATNPPANEELLAALADHFTTSGYDLKALIKTITTSQVYQLSSTPNASNEQDSQSYSRALLRPIPAEVLLDAISQVTGIPEKFQGVAAGARAIELWDSSVKHEFLRLFGRPARKSACECERVSEPSVSQVLHLMNAPSLHAKLTHEAGQIPRLEREIPDDRELVNELYLTVFNRFPSVEEAAACGNFLAKATGPRRQAAVDLAWSLMNTLEFAFNH
jgi:hypothetical protein